MDKYWRKNLSMDTLSKIQIKRSLLFITFSCLCIISIFINFQQNFCALSVFWITCFFYVKGQDARICCLLFLSLLLSTTSPLLTLYIVSMIFWQRLTYRYFFLEHTNPLWMLFKIVSPLLFLSICFESVASLLGQGLIDKNNHLQLLLAALSSQFLGSYLIKHLPEGLSHALREVKISIITFIFLALINPICIIAMMVYHQLELMFLRPEKKAQVAIILKIFITTVLALHLSLFNDSKLSYSLFVFLPSFIHTLNQSWIYNNTPYGLLNFIKNLMYNYHVNTNNDEHTNYTYGELIERELVKVLKPTASTLCHNFIDLGSGNGNICREASKLKKFKKVYGAEVLPSRIYQALKQPRDNITYKFCNLQYQVPSMSEATIAYICATCFEHDLLKAISHNVTNERHYKVIASLKPLPLSSQSWAPPKVISVQCSWDSSPCYIYTRLSN